VSRPSGGLDTATFTSITREFAMKKHNTRERRLVLKKDTMQVLASSNLEVVVGGASNTLPTLCLTVRTCASFEFAC
jgi:hypothetical protein